MKASEAITIINVVFPKGDEKFYGIAYNLNTENTNQHGNVRLTEEEFNSISNGAAGYPNAVLSKINAENTAIEED
ncbi:hypothetical protein OXT66_03315 [Lentilactobacillus senioris]|uniref:hypothetical protein n=1 Tax=Lentilactobacillus senioris TaxID=931534 RepID=UPI00227E329C|nr:hypothetical protein [Lentilactobacillus senioris]MCY9806579.1 hypothetical protein [Lentilactobacillus senioris]